MRAVALVLVLLVTPVAMADDHQGQRHGEMSGADAYKRTVVNCLQAALRPGSTNPESTAISCIKAVDAIWKAAYPAACLVTSKHPRPALGED